MYSALFINWQGIMLTSSWPLPYQDDGWQPVCWPCTMWRHGGSHRWVDHKWRKGAQCWEDEKAKENMPVSCMWPLYESPLMVQFLERSTECTWIWWDSVIGENSHNTSWSVEAGVFHRKSLLIFHGNINRFQHFSG